MTRTFPGRAATAAAVALGVLAALSPGTASAERWDVGVTPGKAVLTPGGETVELTVSSPVAVTLVYDGPGARAFSWELPRGCVPREWDLGVECPVGADGEVVIPVRAAAHAEPGHTVELRIGVVDGFGNAYVDFTYGAAAGGGRRSSPEPGPSASGPTAAASPVPDPVPSVPDDPAPSTAAESVAPARRPAAEPQDFASRVPSYVVGAIGLVLAVLGGVATARRFAARRAA